MEERSKLERRGQPGWCPTSRKERFVGFPPLRAALRSGCIGTEFLLMETEVLLRALERASPGTDVQTQIDQIKQALSAVDKMGMGPALTEQRRHLYRRLWRCESRQLLPRFAQFTP